MILSAGVCRDDIEQHVDVTVPTAKDDAEMQAAVARFQRVARSNEGAARREQGDILMTHSSPRSVEEVSEIFELLVKLSEKFHL